MEKDKETYLIGELPYIVGIGIMKRIGNERKRLLKKLYEWIKKYL